MPLILTGSAFSFCQYKDIHRQHPENIECLRYLVHICTDLGHKEEIQDYAVQLRKAERALAQAQEAAAKAHVYAAAGEPETSAPGSLEGKAARPSSGANGVRQERVGKEAPVVFAPAAALPPRPGTAGRKVKMGVKERSVEDEWGSEELGDDLLPM
jgi:intraflagellar transport protein 88